MATGYKVGALAKVLTAPSTKKNKDLAALFDVNKNENSVKKQPIAPSPSITWKTQQLQRNDSQRKRKISSNSDFEDTTAVKKVKKIPYNPAELRIERKAKQKKKEKGLVSVHKETKQYVSNPDDELRTIFVGNLPNTFKKKALIDLFQEFGEIEAVRFRCAAVPDLKTSKKVAVITRTFHPDRNNMVGFVRFKREESVQHALSRNGYVVEEFHIKVDRVAGKKDHNYNRSVFIGNLPFNVDDEVVYRHFEECGEVEGVRIVRDKKSGLGKGFGYVCFKSPDSVQLALHLANKSIGGRDIRIKRALNVQKDINIDSKKHQVVERMKRPNALPTPVTKKKTPLAKEQSFQGVKAIKKQKKKPKRKEKKKKVFFT